MRGTSANRSIDSYVQTLRYHIWFQISKSQALADSMPESTTGGQADQITVVIDRLVAVTLAGDIVVE